ncbi:peptide MFS transporter [Bacteroides reticulotermitis]|uniref:peptide MFS transporter n=1 Tax=Bacteroides reticulotermitis TaxID=1133319 RepID=UPI001D97AEE4|nr:peptide MFS transporter [Bacteroides reticulotermitis]
MSAIKSHPKGLYLIFATSTAERFSYYGMRAIFILFLTQALMFDKEAAASIYGSYTGLVYLTPLIGGYLADKYWGIRRSIFWGAMMMAVGQFLMFMSASTLNNTEVAHGLMYGGLTFLIMGNGCFKPTVAALVGQLYEPGDKRLDAAYTIFYMGVNVGSFAAPLICGYLGDTGNPQDFKWGFLASGIMTLFTIVLFETQKNKYLFSPVGEPIGIIPGAKREKQKDKAEQIVHPKMDKRMKLRNAVIIGLLTILLITFFCYAFPGDWVSIGIFTACIVFPVLVLLDGSLTKIERSRIFVIYIIAFFVIFFWAAYEQAGASLTLFASEQTDRTILGWEMPASWFQSFNPLFVVLLAYIMPGVWSFLSKRKLEPASPTKQAIGLLLLSLGYLFICFGVKDLIPGVKVSIVWLTGLYFIHTMGEIALSPIGLSMVNKLSPLRFASLMMGIWYLSTATANKFAGMLSGLYPEEGKVKTLFGYQIATMYDFFMVFVIMSGIASLILFLLSKKLQKMMHGVE